MVLDLTIAIPVKNEERNLPGCLQSIGTDFAKEIVLIDSGSTDKTKRIAQETGIHVVEFVWDGKFPKKRNWFLHNHQPATKWILFLDADEYLTEAFKEEVRRELKSSDKVGYWLNYSIYFLGRKLKGGYPLKKLALFRTGAGEYERIDEEQWSHLDMEVHEHPVLEGPVGRICSRIDHRDLRGVSSYVSKHNEYSSWEAARFLKSLETQGSKGSHTWKQKLKYRLAKSVFLGPLYFLGSYVLMGGFRDGRAGLAFALLKMSYFTQVYCKIKELDR